MTAPWTPATAAACGIEELERAIAPGCGFGRTAAAHAVVFRPGDEAAATAASARVAAFARTAGADRLARIRAALAAAPDPLPAASRARAGEVLADADFFDLVRFEGALAEIAALCAGLPEPAPTSDPALLSALEPGRRDAGGFHLDDAFDAALAAERAAGAAAQAAYDAGRSRLGARVAAATGIAHVRDGEFVVMRDAAPNPLPAELRVLREAPTYVVCELALDRSALAALAARDEAAARVADAEEAVRGRLSRSVAAAAPVLQQACARLGDLDLLAARAAFAERARCVVPELRTTDGTVRLDTARFPPLEERLAERGRRYVPISIDLDVLGVVTGPNMGGKTAALRTLGFAAACCMLGVPVPAAAARLPLFDDVVWLGIGGGAEPGDDEPLLSAFGAEVVSLRAFLERPPRRSLVLIDEFARTTSPREGAALLTALLGVLRNRGAIGLAATHLAGIARAAGVAHFAAGRLREAIHPSGPPLALGAALDRIASVMDYALVRVPEEAAHGSDALALAAALGLDRDLLARAEDALRAAP